MKKSSISWIELAVKIAVQGRYISPSPHFLFSLPLCLFSFISIKRTHQLVPTVKWVMLQWHANYILLRRHDIKPYEISTMLFFIALSRFPRSIFFTLPFLIFLFHLSKKRNHEDNTGDSNVSRMSSKKWGGFAWHNIPVNLFQDFIRRF